MVVTIEPGIYVPPSPAFPKHFQNIGIRIEVSFLMYDVLNKCVESPPRG